MRTLSCAIFVLALSLPGFACKNGDRKPVQSGPNTPASQTPTWAPSRTAELFFTTSLTGYVEPCGCTSEPLGGLQRLATVVSGSQVAHGLVDAGGLLFPKKWQEMTRQQHILKSHVITRAYRQIGALALNVAPQELLVGPAHLLALQQEGAVPFVSANVRPRGDHGPEIARSFIRTVGDIRFGITGVALPEAVAQMSEEVTALEYAPALRNEVTALRKEGAEIVVVLAHVGESSVVELAQLLPEIDVLVRAPGTPIERAPAAAKRVGPVLVVEAGSQGQHVGRLRFALSKAAATRPLPLDDQGAKAKRRRALDVRALEAVRVQLEALRADPARAKSVAALERRAVALKAKLAVPMPPPAPPSGPYIRVDILPLTTAVAGDTRVEELLAGYYQQLRAMNLEKGDVEKCVPQKGKPSFVGTSKCVECHEEAFEFWKKTKHADAWETLEKDGKHFDLTCVGCHVVGFQEPGGFCRLVDVAGFEDVGCENCHGPGSVHIDSEDSDDIVLEAPREICAGVCHVPEHSDGFEYRKYLKQITGPGHELSEG